MDGPEVSQTCPPVPRTGTNSLIAQEEDGYAPEQVFTKLRDWYSGYHLVE